jgi:hypothetical protein
MRFTIPIAQDAITRLSAEPRFSAATVIGILQDFRPGQAALRHLSESTPHCISPTGDVRTSDIEPTVRAASGVLARRTSGLSTPPSTRSDARIPCLRTATEYRIPLAGDSTNDDIERTIIAPSRVSALRSSGAFTLRSAWGDSQASPALFCTPD